MQAPPLGFLVHLGRCIGQDGKRVITMLTFNAKWVKGVGRVRCTMHGLEYESEEGSRRKILRS